MGNEGQDKNDEEGEEEERNEEEEGDEDRDEEDEDRDEQNGNNQEYFQGQNKYGYVNAYGEWVSTYKTMYQIQKSNIIIWTSVIMIVVTIVSTGMMIFMPLLP